MEAGNGGRRQAEAGTQVRAQELGPKCALALYTGPRRFQATFFPL